MTKALLFFSFGGPNGPDDVLDFMANVTRNRPIPAQRLIEVSKHYFGFGGKSPINEINLDLIERTKVAFAKRGIDLGIYFGNRNWTPYLGDALREMISDSIDDVVVFVTSAYGSFSGCRQYRQDLNSARLSSANPAISLFKLRHFYNHPGFIEPFVDGTIQAIESLVKKHDPSEIELLFSAHSIPIEMTKTSDYLTQLASVRNYIVGEVTQRLGLVLDQQQVFQSRSGPPTQPWLEPDISDAIRESYANQKRAFVVVPIGFISDHMEVIYDLDTLARQTATEVGASFERVNTPSGCDAFADLIADLVQEQLDPTFSSPKIAGIVEPYAMCRPDCCITLTPPG